MLGSFLYNWQTLIAGGLAVLAAAGGGLIAYRAGRIQADATKNFARRQLLANAKPICVLMPFDGVDPWDKRDALLSISEDSSRSQRFRVVELKCNLRNVGVGPALNLAIMFRFLDMNGYSTAPWDLSPLYPGDCRGEASHPLKIPVQILEGFNDADFSQIEGKLWEIVLLYKDVFGNH